MQSSYKAVDAASDYDKSTDSSNMEVSYPDSTSLNKQIKDLARQYTQASTTNINNNNDNNDDIKSINSQNDSVLSRIMTSMSKVPGIIPISDSIDPRLDPL
ncbi:hypothetical protein C6P40_004207, partial [Pichia californica]